MAPGSTKGGDHTALCEPGDEGGGVPMTMGRGHAQALAARGPAVGASHVGLGPGLVDEHQPVGVESGLAVTPGVPPAQNVRASLLHRMSSIFSREAVAHEKALDRPIAEDQTAPAQSGAQLLNGHVPLLLKKARDHCALSLDTPRTAIPAKCFRASVTLFAHQPALPAHARRAHPQTAPQPLYGSDPLKPLTEPEYEDQGKGLSTSSPASFVPVQS